MREGLRLVLEEGLGSQFARHRSCAETLWEGLEALGLLPLIAPELRSPTLTTVQLPAEVDDITIRTRLMEEYNIEISGGFGPLAGQIWRIGLMGHSARHDNVHMLLKTLELVLKQ